MCEACKNAPIKGVADALEKEEEVSEKPQAYPQSFAQPQVQMRSQVQSQLPAQRQEYREDAVEEVEEGEEEAQPQSFTLKQLTTKPYPSGIDITKREVPLFNTNYMKSNSKATILDVLER